jgi:C_GCAxxG_C_C family probable redox protein
MDPADKAIALFRQGYNCAQATAASFADRLELDEKVILRMMSGFGAGMGGLRETCGAVTAMVFVVGTVAGNYAPNDRASKKALYDTVKQMVREFSDRHGTTVCAGLLRSAACSADPDPSDRTDAYYAQRPCARLVATAAEILAKVLGQASTPR